MTTEAATLPGVEAKPTERDSMIASLAAAARKERDDEIRANGGEVVDTLNVEKKEEEPPHDENGQFVAVEPEPAPAEPPKAEDPPPAPQPAEEEFVTVKVDGQERQVSKAMILEAGIKTVQKESAADRRLEEATRLLREAQEASKPKTQPLPDMDEVELAQRIRMGNDQEAAEAMRVLKGRSQDAATPEQIAAAVESRVMDQMTARAALQKVQSDYPEIFSNPTLTQVASMYDAQMLNAGDSRSYSERFTEIGERIRKDFQIAKGGKPEVATMPNKQERKATITNLPSASVRQAAPEQPKPRTTAQIIDDMRKARGQSA